MTTKKNEIYINFALVCIVVRRQNLPKKNEQDKLNFYQVEKSLTDRKLFFSARLFCLIH